MSYSHFLKVKAKVRYWEDATVNDKEDIDGKEIPCRSGEYWCPVIDIDTGRIINWTIGKSADINYKVCDCCSWSFCDIGINEMYGVENEYVPNILCPKGEGYGDYIKMFVNSQGLIFNWNKALIQEIDSDYDPTH